MQQQILPYNTCVHGSHEYFQFIEQLPSKKLLCANCWCFMDYYQKKSHPQSHCILTSKQFASEQTFIKLANDAKKISKNLLLLPFEKPPPIIDNPPIKTQEEKAESKSQKEEVGGLRGFLKKLLGRSEEKDEKAEKQEEEKIEKPEQPEKKIIHRQAEEIKEIKKEVSKIKSAIQPKGKKKEGKTKVNVEKEEEPIYVLDDDGVLASNGDDQLPKKKRAKSKKKGNN